MNEKGRHRASEASRPGKDVWEVADAEGVVAIARQVADEVADASLGQARKDVFALLEPLRQRCVEPSAV